MLSIIPKPRLGYGCYALGGAYGHKVEPSEAIKLIETAYDLGIRFFDTADQYGSEEVLGRATYSFRKQIAIASKVGAGPGGIGNLTRSHILASCDASLQRLGTDYLDLYHVHYDDASTPVADVVETLEFLKNQGKIRAYGIGHLPLDKTREYLVLGKPKSIMTELNVASPARYRELLPLYGQYELSIIAFSITGRGLLTGKISPSTQFPAHDIRSHDPLFKRHKLASGLRIMGKLQDMGKRVGATPAQLAIAWVLNQKGIALALTGPTNPDHLRENCSALDLRLEKSCLAELDAFLYREGEYAREQITQDVMEILNATVTRENQGVEDLIYVLEHCIETELIPYTTGVQLFSRLCQDKNPRLETLEAVKAEIKSSITTEYTCYRCQYPDGHIPR